MASSDEAHEISSSENHDPSDVELEKKEERVQVVETGDDDVVPPRKFLGIPLPAYFSKDPERALVRKMDLFILSYTVLSNFMQNLDNSNI